jgi:outer membrane protein assembly factor BamB
MKHTVPPAIFFSILTVSLSYSADWPEFRGPTAQGLYEGPALPIKWGREQNVVWKKPIPGVGWSSPVVAGGKIYLTSAVPKSDDVRNGDQSLRAMCLSAETGKVVWDHEVFLQEGRTAPKIQAKNSHASPTPIVHGNRLYVHFGHQGTACLDLDGKVIWRNRELKYPPVHGNGGSPELVDDVLIFSCDGGNDPFVVALDAGNGKVKWKKPRSFDYFKHFSFCTPLVIEVHGSKQVILPGSGGVIAYDPKTGEEIWKVAYEGYSVVPRPVYGQGLVFVSSGYDSPQLLAIRPDGKGDVTNTHIAWRLKRDAPLNPSPLLVGEELYIVSDKGTASCLSARTGDVHWSERLGGAYSASPLFADGKIFFLSEEGRGIVVKAGKQFEELARNDLRERALASFAAADGALYIRTEKNLYRVQTSK